MFICLSLLPLGYRKARISLLRYVLMRSSARITFTLLEFAKIVLGPTDPGERKRRKKAMGAAATETTKSLPALDRKGTAGKLTVSGASNSNSSGSTSMRTAGLKKNSMGFIDVQGVYM